MRRWQVVGIGIGIVFIAGMSLCSGPETETQAETDVQSKPESTESVDVEPDAVGLTLVEETSIAYLEVLNAAHDQAIAARDKFPECRGVDIFLSAREEAKAQNIRAEEMLLRRLVGIQERNREVIGNKTTYTFDAKGSDEFENPSNDVAAILMVLKDLADDGEFNTLNLNCQILIDDYWRPIEDLTGTGFELLRRNRQHPKFVVTDEGGDDE